MALKETLSEATRKPLVPEEMVADTDLLVPFLSANFEDCGVEHGLTLASALFAFNQGNVMLLAAGKFLFESYEPAKAVRYNYSGEFCGTYAPLCFDRLSSLPKRPIIDNLLGVIKQEAELFSARGNPPDCNQEFVDRYYYKLSRSLDEHVMKLAQYCEVQIESGVAIQKLRKLYDYAPDLVSGGNTGEIAIAMYLMISRENTELIQVTFIPVYDETKKQVIPLLEKAGYTK